MTLSAVMCESSQADLIVHRLDEFKFFFQRLTTILSVDMLQCLIIQILKHISDDPALFITSYFHGRV